MRRRNVRTMPEIPRLIFMIFAALILLMTGGAVYYAATSTTPQVSVQPGVTVRCDGGKFSTVDSATVSCESTTTSSSTSSTTSTSTTTTTTMPSTLSCDTTVGLIINGDQSRAFSGAIPAHATTNVAAATWSLPKVGDYAVTVDSANQGSCWDGGRILGNETNPLTATAPWTTYHYRAGFRFYQPGMTIANTESSYYGDAFKPKGNAADWHLKRVFVAHAYDDCLENDYLNRGTLEDSLLNCYVGYSARPSSGQGTAPNGTVNFDHVAMRLDPQRNVYKGSVPGTGGWFKLDPLSPPMRITNSVFRADQLPNHQDLNPPTKLTACTGNTVLWGGSGDFPARAAWMAACPDTQFFTGNQAKTVWELYVQAWKDNQW